VPLSCNYDPTSPVRSSPRRKLPAATKRTPDRLYALLIPCGRAARSGRPRG
jgi:hypothetical protein